MIEATDYQEILFDVKDDVAWITINRPEVMNAFREQTLDELIHAVRSTREDSIPGSRCHHRRRRSRLLRWR